MRDWSTEIGKKFNKITLIKRIGYINGKHTWLFRCDCGVEKQGEYSAIVRGETKTCRTCRRDWGVCYGTGITPRLWSNIIHGAKKRKIPLSVTVEEVWKLLNQQNFRCALSNEPIVMGKKTKDTTASLDRIDSNKGYVVGNVQWVHKDVNLMKNVLEQPRFIDLCKAIAKKHQKKR